MTNRRNYVFEYVMGTTGEYLHEECRECCDCGCIVPESKLTRSINYGGEYCEECFSKLEKWHLQNAEEGEVFA